jgi:hypothetical protein
MQTSCSAGSHRLRLAFLIVWCECAVFIGSGIDGSVPLQWPQGNKPCLVASGCPCVESTAATSTCTAVDQELYTYGGGAACTGSSTKCVPGDGNIPVCTCTNGTPTLATGAAGTLCTADGEDCSACAAGYHLSDTATDSTATTCVGETPSRFDPSRQI